MSEPRARADAAEEIAPGVWHWRVHDERIGFVSAAHALRGPEGTVLIDPLPLADEALAALGPVVAICLTTSSHQRSSWRLRRQLDVPVYAPALARAVDEEPDVRYNDGDRLPGELLAMFTPGAGTAQHTFLAETVGGRVVFTPDLFVRAEGEPLAFTPARYMHDPRQARESARSLLGRDFSVLCTGHGLPVLRDPHAAIREALARSA